MAQNNAIDDLIAKFEEVAKIDDAGVEFWFARDLQVLLGYEKSWQNFSNVVEKAKTACEASGHNVSDHFNDVIKMVSLGLGAGREVDDIRLTRYACYLIAQNGDSKKKQISFAQTYFAIQTRRQEIRDNAISSEDQKRLLLREEIKNHNIKLASVAKGAGVIEPLDFAIFQTFGYKGLYGGLDRAGIQRKKGLKPKDKILDYMGSTELAANLFRTTQTEEKLISDRIKDKDHANKTHHEIGQKVRRAIADIGGTMPENLPPAGNIAKVNSQLQKSAKIKAAKE